jgi:quinone-modifying oxidoreductase subunit QmoC
MLTAPRYLPVLLGIPIILILVLQAVSGHLGFPEGEIVFDKFFPHHVLDPLFIIAALFATVAVVIGISRFWNDMESGGAPPAAGERLGIVPSAIAALKEVATHEKFRKCDAASPRNLSHLLVFYGFVALFITTTAVFFGLYTPKVFALMGMSFPELTPLPMPLYHPVKILGNLGAISFAAGLALMVYQRVTNKEKAGVSNYYDVLFLAVMCGLAITGILTEVIRLAGLGVLAYSIYFIHLVLVFFLIAYLPYSKFAHIVYRTVAILHLKHTRRA